MNFVKANIDKIYWKLRRSTHLNFIHGHIQTLIDVFRYPGHQVKYYPFFEVVDILITQTG